MAKRAPRNKMAIESDYISLPDEDAADETTDNPLEGELSGIAKAKKPDKELQHTLKDFLSMALPEMLTTFDVLPITKQWDLIIQLLPYATPKMQSSEVNTNIGIDLSSQLGQLANTSVEELKD